MIARALRDAGFEVIYSGLHQTPAQIAEAVQEDVDAVGLSSLSGAHKTLFPQVVEELAAYATDIVVFGGGVIPEADFQALLDAGLATIFTPGLPRPDHVVGRVQCPGQDLGEALEDPRVPGQADHGCQGDRGTDGSDGDNGRGGGRSGTAAHRGVGEPDRGPQVADPCRGQRQGTFKEHPDLRGVNVITDGVEGGPEAAEERVR